MSYFDYTPIELIELIIPYLDTEGLALFQSIYDVKDKINWNNVYFLHFGDTPNNKLNSHIISYKEYNDFLSIENLIFKLKFKHSVKTIYNWKEFNLSHSDIKEIPPEIGNLINLDRLYFHNNQIRKIPSEIGNLINLDILSLSYNNIGEIPTEIGKLTNLKMLNLNYNKIKSVPDDMRKLINLQYLDLENNKLNNEEVIKLKLLLPNTHITF